MVMILAHRGAHEVARENTVEAFREARHRGADGVELDVRVTADGALVVHHDAGIAGLGPIAALRVAELPAYVPLLETAMAACGDLVVNIEMKELAGEPGYDPTYLVARLVARFLADNPPAGRVIVSSFDLLALDAARDRAPSLETAWLTPRWLGPSLGLEAVCRQGHPRLHPHYEGVTPALIGTAHDAGVAIAAWTVDDPAIVGRLASAGIDAIITNLPEVARASLARSALRERASPG